MQPRNRSRRRQKTPIVSSKSGVRKRQLYLPKACAEAYVKTKFEEINVLQHLCTLARKVLQHLLTIARSVLQHVLTLARNVLQHLRTLARNVLQHLRALAALMIYVWKTV